MTSVICTLFEGGFHRGLGALVNSLYRNGYRGAIYIGYRGRLPPWVTRPTEGDGLTKFSPAQGLTLQFMPLETPIHLTNFKPDFMLTLWQKHCPQADSMFYFDPDITVVCRWSFFEEWVQAGIALCADVNSSMPANHPIRHAWRKFYLPHGITFRREPDLYFNGGFVGLKREHTEFLHCWQRLQELMTPEVGGLQNVNVRDRSFLFCKTDQDALNVAAMACEAPISPMGQDGMDFQHGGGGYVMSHASGIRKPWDKKFLSNLLLRGNSPSRADRVFFRSVESPIQLYSSATLSYKRLLLLTASFLGRFMSKG
ncbi:MAG: hypothetical protein ABSA83_04475 [Verrucomicrobiota bacterium]|jgi:hypothetical protein